MKNNSTTSVAIVGAGLAGLGAGYKLAKAGLEPVLFEAESEVGGFARSFSSKECTFDYGPHAFHAPSEDILEFFFNLMGDEVLTLEKNVQIKYRKHYYNYPIKIPNLMKNMSFWEILRAVFSFLSEYVFKFSSKNAVPGTLENFYWSLYGHRLYHLFFENYTQKVWGFHPKELSNNFLKHRLPSFNLIKLGVESFLELLKIQRGKVHTQGMIYYQYYPKKGSGRFPNRLKEEIEGNGGIINTSSEVNKIFIEDRKITAFQINTLSNGEQTYNCKTCISTISLTSLIKLMSPAPPLDVVDAAKRLKFRAILIVCLVIKKDEVITCDALYFHHCFFNRVGQMNSYSKETTPEGKTALTCEITCFKDDEIWKMSDEEILNRTLTDLEAEGFPVTDLLEDYFVLRNEFGYPIPTLGYEKDLAHVLSYIHNIENLYIGGREGLFTYIQMFHALQMGFKIADHIISGREKLPLEFDKEGKQLAGKEPFFV